MKNKHKMDKFAEEYIGSNFNGQHAMKSISPKLEGGSLRTMTSRWLHSPEVLSTICEKLAKLNLTPDKVKKVISARLLDIILSYKNKDGDVIGASSLLAKLEKLTNDNVQATQVNVYQDIVREFESKGNNRHQ